MERLRTWNRWVLSLEIEGIVDAESDSAEDRPGRPWRTDIVHNETLMLTVNKRINFKIASLAYQSLAFGQPTYLSLVLTPHQPQRSLRSVNQNLLSVQRCSSSFGLRSFSYCVPKIWNDIPLSVRQSPSLDSFKRNLKTHYFAYNWPPVDCLQRLWFHIFDSLVHFTNCREWMNEWMEWMNVC